MAKSWLACIPACLYTCKTTYVRMHAGVYERVCAFGCSECKMGRNHVKELPPDVNRDWIWHALHQAAFLLAPPAALGQAVRPQCLGWANVEVWDGDMRWEMERSVLGA